MGGQISRSKGVGDNNNRNNNEKGDIGKDGEDRDGGRGGRMGSGDCKGNVISADSGMRRGGKGSILILAALADSLPSLSTSSFFASIPASSFLTTLVWTRKMTTETMTGANQPKPQGSGSTLYLLSSSLSPHL